MQIFAAHILHDEAMGLLEVLHGGKGDGAGLFRLGLQLHISPIRGQLLHLALLLATLHDFRAWKEGKNVIHKLGRHHPGSELAAGGLERQAARVVPLLAKDERTLPGGHHGVDSLFNDRVALLPGAASTICDDCHLGRDSIRAVVLDEFPELDQPDVQREHGNARGRPVEIDLGPHETRNQALLGKVPACEGHVEQPQRVPLRPDDASLPERIDDRVIDDGIRLALLCHHLLEGLDGKPPLAALLHG